MWGNSRLAQGLHLCLGQRSICKLRMRIVTNELHYRAEAERKDTCELLCWGWSLKPAL